MSIVQAVLFDTFGTVVDWRSGVSREVRDVAEQRGLDLNSDAFADAWRSRYQPAMDPIRSGERRFMRLTELHRENLAATLTEFSLDLTAEETDRLNRVWERLDAWPDSVEGLGLLKRHYIIGPLSNGDTALLTRLAKHAQLPWDVVIGADLTQRYKPDPEAYRRTAAILDLSPAAVMLVAAHNRDLSAARAAGLATAFVARPTEYGPMQRHDLEPEEDWDLVAVDLVALAQLLTR